MSAAIAYLLTWTCYGTRIHGDERGTVDDAHNTFGTPYLSPDSDRQYSVRDEMSEIPWKMDEHDRLAVREAIKRTAEVRRWRISRVSVRTNHVHIVVEAPGEDPAHVAAIFKTWATRALKTSGRHNGRSKFWTNQSSTRHIFTDQELFQAYEYVVNQ